jgi:hypothetical protein
MLTLTRIALIAGVVYPVGTPESELEGMTDGERQSLVSTQILSEPMGDSPGSDQPPGGQSPGSNTAPVLTDASELAAFGVGKKLVELMAANDPPLRTKGDVIAYLKDHENLVAVGRKPSGLTLNSHITNLTNNERNLTSRRTSHRSHCR